MWNFLQLCFSRVKLRIEPDVFTPRCKNYHNYDFLHWNFRLNLMLSHNGCENSHNCDLICWSFDWTWRVHYRGLEFQTTKISSVEALIWTWWVHTPGVKFPTIVNSSKSFKYNTWWWIFNYLSWNHIKSFIFIMFFLSTLFLLCELIIPER